MFFTASLKVKFDSSRMVTYSFVKIRYIQISGEYRETNTLYFQRILRVKEKNINFRSSLSNVNFA